jgi:hypothetical protein
MEEMSESSENVGYLTNAQSIDNSINRYQITINPLNYGYSVVVGCQSLAFETKESLIKALTSYLNDPIRIEKDWNNGLFLKKV